MKLKLVEEETCPRCRVKFNCGKSGKCWCYEVELKPSVLENIQKTYNSCLCPACLNELSKME